MLAQLREKLDQKWAQIEALRPVDREDETKVVVLRSLLAELAVLQSSISVLERAVEGDRGFKE